MFDSTQQLSQLTSGIPAVTEDVLRIVIAGEVSSRDEVASIAGAFDDVLVLGELDSDETLAARLRVLTPDVLVCDAGASAASLAWLASVTTPSLVLLSTPGQRAFALAAGAQGVLDRSASPRSIHAALLAVGEGLHVSDAPSESQALSDPLTARELDVLRLLAAGLTNKEIAHRLRITEHTVKFHVNAILGKLDAETRTEAVVNAARRGIVAL